MKEEKLIQNSEIYVKCQQSEFSFMSIAFSTFSLSPESFTFKILAKNSAISSEGMQTNKHDKQGGKPGNNSVKKLPFKKLFFH